jgi:hypothetical protein
MNVDLDRIAKLLGVAGSSAHAGEVLAAIRAADRELRKAGLGWADLIIPSCELAVADEANAALLAENLSMREELDSIRGREGRGQWDDVASGGGNVNATAQWALDLYEHHTAPLTAREVDFLRTCRRWRGRLTAAQQEWFDDLIGKISARTGHYPPA